MEKIKQYQKIGRIEQCIIEEKIDGSNFCWYFDGTELHFFSRTREVKLGMDKFFDKFIQYIIDKHKEVPFIKDEKWFAEALGQAHIKYNMGENIHNKLWVFDIQKSDKVIVKKSFFKKEIKEKKYWYRRDELEERINHYGLNIVPLTTLNNTQSILDTTLKREGVILKYENINSLNGKVLKLKYVEQTFLDSRGKSKFGSKFEIKEIE